MINATKPITGVTPTGTKLGTAGDKTIDPIPVGQKATSVEKVDEHPYAESKVHYVELKISDRQDQLLLTHDATKKAAIQKEIAALKAKKKSQEEFASMAVDSDGNIEMKIKKELTAKELKELFDIQDGALRDKLDLEPEYRTDDKMTGPKDEGRQTYKDYDSARIKKGQKIIFDPSEINNQGFFQELWKKLSLGN